MTEILRRHAFSITFLSILLVFAFLWGGEEQEIHRLSGYTMGTSYELQLVDLPDADRLEEIQAQVQVILDRLDREIFSTYAADSELSRFNRHPVNTAFSVTNEMLDVLLMAAEIARLSEGAFDVTIGPLVNLWGFGPELRLPDSRVPSTEDIELASRNVGYEYLQVSQGQSEIRKTRDIYVDLSAIAKGYAVDKVGEYFDSLGIDSYFLEIGGELKMKGLKPGGESWIPAIEAPVDGQTRIYEIFFSRGDELAVAGSGDYRNYFEEDGVRYSHELDPRTGRPINHKLAAVYVIDESAARADALATAYMILGLEQGRQLAEATGQAVYFIYKSEPEGFDNFYTEQFAYYLSN